MDDRTFGYPTDFHVACLYARAGEKDKAFEYLERSYQQRECAMPQLHVHPQLDPIGDDPCFKALVDRIEKNDLGRYLRYRLQKQMPPLVI